MQTVRGRERATRRSVDLPHRRAHPRRRSVILYSNRLHL